MSVKYFRDRGGRHSRCGTNNFGALALWRARLHAVLGQGDIPSARCYFIGVARKNHFLRMADATADEKGSRSPRGNGVRLTRSLWMTCFSSTHPPLGNSPDKIGCTISSWIRSRRVLLRSFSRSLISHQDDFARLFDLRCRRSLRKCALE
jgi:hypothetical protein